MINLENFILVKEDCYFINLNLFLGAEDFNLCLLEFLGKYCRAKKSFNANREYDIYILEFNDIQVSGEDHPDIINEDRKSIPFLYPFIDKALSFNHIFELYLYVFNSSCIYLCIKKL